MSFVVFSYIFYLSYHHWGHTVSTRVETIKGFMINIAEIMLCTGTI